MTGWQLATIVTTARLAGHVVPCAAQPQYNVLDRGIETELLPCCLDEGLGVAAWSPLGGGWLTGKYQADQRPTGTTRLGEDPNRGVEAYDTRNTPRIWDVLDVVRDIARTQGVSMAEIAVAWLLARPAVATVLLGARTAEQLATTIRATRVVLTDDDRDRLTVVSAPGLAPYPYAMIKEFCGVEHWTNLGSAGS